MTRSLEAYLLWLFGYIMFNNSHGHCVDRVFLPYAQEIADADEDVIPFIVGVQRFLHAHIVDSAMHHGRMIGMLS